LVYILKLPVFLDAVGTVLVTILAGIPAGIATGLLSFLLGGLLVNPVMPNFSGHAGGHCDLCRAHGTTRLLQINSKNHSGKRTI
jgi:hypothetical protein